MSRNLTAVQWLVEQIDNKDMGEIPMWIYDFCYDAKAMEKEQIIEAYLSGDTDSVDNPLITAEQYYTSTFNS